MKKNQTERKKNEEKFNGVKRKENLIGLNERKNNYFQWENEEKVNEVEWIKKEKKSVWMMKDEEKIIIILNDKKEENVMNLNERNQFEWNKNVKI